MKKFLIVMAIAAAAFFFIQKSIGGQKDSTRCLTPQCWLVNLL